MSSVCKRYRSESVLFFFFFFSLSRHCCLTILIDGVDENFRINRRHINLRTILTSNEKQGVLQKNIALDYGRGTCFCQQNTYSTTRNRERERQSTLYHHCSLVYWYPQTWIYKSSLIRINETFILFHLRVDTLATKFRRRACRIR